MRYVPSLTKSRVGVADCCVYTVLLGRRRRSFILKKRVIKATLESIVWKDELPTKPNPSPLHRLSDTCRDASCFLVDERMACTQLKGPLCSLGHVPAKGAALLGLACIKRTMYECALAAVSVRRVLLLHRCVVTARKCHDAAEQSSSSGTGSSFLPMHAPSSAERVANPAREGRPRLVSGSFKFGNTTLCLHPAISRDEEPHYDAAGRVA